MKVLFFLALIFGLSVAYLQFNPSYKLSIEAKYFYTMGEYDMAYRLADQSLKLSEYNTMAFYVKTRSKLTLEVINFNKEAQEFEDRIRNILKKGSISRYNKLRSKMMSDIIISKYIHLSLPMVEDEEVKNLALKNVKKFKKINSQVKIILK